MTVQFSHKLDNEYLIALYEDDMEYAAHMFGEFLSGIRKDVGELKMLLEQGKKIEFKTLIHKIKPTFSYVGLSTLTKDAEEMEKVSLLTENTGDLDRKFNEFCVCIADVLPVVESEFERLKNL